MLEPDSSTNSTETALPQHAADVSTDGRGSLDEALREACASGSPDGAVYSRKQEERTPKPEGSPAMDGSRGPGRPRGDTMAVLERMMDVIRKMGISDSKAAGWVGVSTSTLSRWKAESPELKEALAMAREEFRGRQLEVLLKAAQAEHGRGWRAAAWLLERVFPADYARTAAERDRAEQRERRQQMQEEAEEDVQRIVQEYTERTIAREVREQEEKARAEAMRQGEGESRRITAAAEGASSPEAEEVKPTSQCRPVSTEVSDSQNARNATGQLTSPQAAELGLNSVIFSGKASHNSRNAGLELWREPAPHRPTARLAVLTGSLFQQRPQPLAHAA